MSGFSRTNLCCEPSPFTRSEYKSRPRECETCFCPPAATVFKKRPNELLNLKGRLCGASAFSASFRESRTHNSSAFRATPSSSKRNSDVFLPVPRKLVELITNREFRYTLSRNQFKTCYFLPDGAVSSSAEPQVFPLLATLRLLRFRAFLLGRCRGDRPSVQGFLRGSPGRLSARSSRFRIAVARRLQLFDVSPLNLPTKPSLNDVKFSAQVPRIVEEHAVHAAPSASSGRCAPSGAGAGSCGSGSEEEG